MAESNNNLNAEDLDSGMESVNRVAKLPIVESAATMASEFYYKVKESNEMANVVLSKAESTMMQAVNISKPVTAKLEGPLKKMDSVLCTGLDYVESSVPAIKLPPQEMYEVTKNAVVNTVEPAMKTVYSMGEQGVHKVSSTVSSTFSRSSNTCEQKQHCCLHKDQPCPNSQDNQ